MAILAQLISDLQTYLRACVAERNVPASPVHFLGANDPDLRGLQQRPQSQIDQEFASFGPADGEERVRGHQKAGL